MDFKEIDGKRIPYRMLKNQTICGPKFVNMSKTIVIDVESMSGNWMDLVDIYNDNKDIDTILYTVDEKWTKELATMYFYFLTKLDSDRKLNIYDKSRYTPDPQNIYSNKCRCEADSNGLAILVNHSICDSLEDIELSEKCTFCPIKSGCPNCRVAYKEGICYMHQVEAVICILINGGHPTNVYRGSIPYLWIKDLLGICVADCIEDLRHTTELRWLYNIGSADLILTFKDARNNSALKRVLDFEEVHYEICENGDVLVIPTEDLIADHIFYKLNINNIEFECAKRYMSFKDFENGIIKSYIPQDPYYIEDISFSLDKPADIVDIIATSACKPQSVYTQFMIRTILKYIKPDMDVLDIGCGKGMLCMVAKLKGAEVTAIDLDEEAIVDIHRTMDVNNYTDDDILVVHQDATTFIKHCDKTYDMIFGNLTANIQCTAVLPYIDKIMNENSIYLIGGFNSLIEKHLNKYISEATNLKILEIYYYNSIEIMVLKKRGDFN